jgi:hypothetical protein
MKCAVCKTEMSPKRKKYCSIPCANRGWREENPERYRAQEQQRQKRRTRVYRQAKAKDRQPSTVRPLVAKRIAEIPFEQFFERLALLLTHYGTAA